MTDNLTRDETPRDPLHEALTAGMADVLTKDWPGDTRLQTAPAIVDYLLALPAVRAALASSTQGALREMDRCDACGHYRGEHYLDQRVPQLTRPWCHRSRGMMVPDCGCLEFQPAALASSTQGALDRDALIADAREAARLRTAAEDVLITLDRVVSDSESQHPGGWGPDVTTVADLRDCQDVLRAALAKMRETRDETPRHPSDEERMAEMLVDRALAETPRDPLRKSVTVLETHILEALVFTSPAVERPSTVEEGQRWLREYRAALASSTQGALDRDALQRVCRVLNMTKPDEWAEAIAREYLTARGQHA